ncbi:MAG: hypothetical protein HQL70_10005 [Magnetococcales bacterium]|nr:hypothetical protein [Magnetococcales bacterium]
MDRDGINLLISRGLDGDLDREEIATLYRLVADDPTLTVEMGEVARLQEELAQFNRAINSQAPQSNLGKRAVEAINRDRKQKNSFAGRSGRFLQWLLSPKGLALQPLSFAGGILAAMLVVWVSPPVKVMPDNSIAPVASRLEIHDVQFVNAKARVNWTNQFIIPPGSSTRLTLDEGLEPVKIQLESVESTRLTITHISPTRGEETVRSFVVNGIGYATLSQPRSGDAVAIENSGQVPVLVYMRNAAGVTVSEYSAKNISHSL